MIKHSVMHLDAIVAREGVMEVLTEMGLRLSPRDLRLVHTGLEAAFICGATVVSEALKESAAPDEPSDN